MGSQGITSPTLIGALGTTGNLANSAGNIMAGPTGSGIGTVSHATSWQHRVASNYGQAQQIAANGRRTGPIQARIGTVGKAAGRLAILPTIWEGYWDIGLMVYCGCSN